MARVLRVRNYGVYVYDERGQPHHLPHAHIKHRETRIATVYLYTLKLEGVVEPVPADVLAVIRAGQQELLARWEELNNG